MEKYKVEVYDDVTYWYKYDTYDLHRIDGPAVEWGDGSKFWYLNDQRHRVDGPAVERTNGIKEWYLNGVKHRTEGPAVEYANGDKYWYLNDQLHRTDGPAVEYANGDKYWYLNDQLHRTDGPAVEYASTKEWWLNGVELTEEEFNAKTNTCDGKVVEIEWETIQATGSISISVKKGTMMKLTELKEFADKAKTIMVFCKMSKGDGEFFAVTKESFEKTMKEGEWWLEDEDIDAVFEGTEKILKIG